MRLMRRVDGERWEPVGPVLSTPETFVDESDRALLVMHFSCLPTWLGAQAGDRLVIGETAKELRRKCGPGERGYQVLVDHVERTFDDRHAERLAAHEVWLVEPLQRDAETMTAKAVELILATVEAACAKFLDELDQADS